MLSSNPKDLSLVTKLALYTRPSRSGEKGIRDKCFVNFAAKEQDCFGQKQVQHAEQTRWAHNQLINDNTLASLEASKPGGAAAKQSLEKYYQKMDKSKGVFNKDWMKGS